MRAFVPLSETEEVGNLRRPADESWRVAVFLDVGGGRGDLRPFRRVALRLNGKRNPRDCNPWAWAASGGRWQRKDNGGETH